MKKCPKCGADNSPDSSACYNCYASLDGVESTGEPATPESPAAPEEPQPAAPPQAAHPPQPPTAPPADILYGQQFSGPLVEAEDHGEPVSVVGQPLSGYPGAQQGGAQPPSYGPPTRPRYYRRGDFSKPRPPRPSNIGSVITTIVMLAILFGGGGFVIWKFFLLPKGPQNAARQFVVALTTNDVEGFSASVSASSQRIVDAFRMSPSGVSSLNFFRSQNQGFEEGREYTLEVASVENTTAKVSVKPGPMPIQEFKEENLAALGVKDGFSLVVVKEGKEWKVDLMETLKGIGGPVADQVFGQIGGRSRTLPGAPAAPHK